MTCNPYWAEITSNLEPGQEPQDRPELVARVYKAKLRDLKDLLIKRKYFGDVAAYVHVTEFQKRGLPHEHFPELHDLVISHMLHEPCGVLDKNCACMVDEECRFQYPRQFCEATQ